MKRKKPSQIALLRAEIEALRKELRAMAAEIAALKVMPTNVTHNHYHFGEGGLGQPAPTPEWPPLRPWPNSPWIAPQAPYWWSSATPVITCGDSIDPTNTATTTLWVEPRSINTALGGSQ